MTRTNKVGSKERSFDESFTFDPSFEYPVKKRSCTDLAFLLAFIAFIIGWMTIAVLGYQYGDPDKIIFPTDTFGNVCGRDRFKDKPNLLFFDLLKCAKTIDSKLFNRCLTPQVCVSQCPTKSFSLHKVSPNDIINKYRDSLVCVYDVNPTVANIEQLIREDKCAEIYLKSEPIGGRCIPSLLSMSGSELFDDVIGKSLTTANGSITLDRIKSTNKAIVFFLNAKDIGSKIIQDLSQTLDWIFIGLTLAMVVSFLWIVCIQWFAQIMIWFSILAVIALNALGLYYSINRYNQLNSGVHIFNATSKSSSNIQTYDFRRAMDPNLDSYFANRKTWYAFSIICAVVLAILLVLLLYLRKRIKLAIALITEASRAVSCVKSSLFFPIIPYTFQLLIISIWGFVTILITSSARTKLIDPKTGKECINATNDCLSVKNFDDNYILGAQLYNLFALIWGLFFAVGIGQVSLAGAFSSYYWTFEKPKDVPYFTVFGGLRRCVRYHIGSVALGSFLIATVRFIRIILEYIDKKCKKYANNVIAKAIMCCCKCWFWLLETFLRYVNKNAYIMIAIYGQGFCASASNGFFLILRNATRAVVLDKVTDLLLIIGKVSVTSLVSVLSFYVFTNKIEFIAIPVLNYYWVPIAVITFGTYLISSSFFSVYHMAVDTLFLCFLEDCERNDGSPEKPYYMSKTLMKVLKKKNM